MHLGCLGSLPPHRRYQSISPTSCHLQSWICIGLLLWALLLLLWVLLLLRCHDLVMNRRVVWLHCGILLWLAILLSLVVVLVLVLVLVQLP